MKKMDINVLHKKIQDQQISFDSLDTNTQHCSKAIKQMHHMI